MLAGLDAAYFAFARRQRTIALRTTCTCAACAGIAALDLKVIAHHGAFVEHLVAGSSEIVGSDVIAAHRLLKNDVADRTGVKAFALITDACVTELGIEPEALGLAALEERYDDVGTIAGWVRDLGARWADAERRNVIRVESEEADFAVSGTCPGSRPQVWDAVTSPEKILVWKNGATAVEMDNPSGAREVGSTTHCVHGRQAFDQEILDWRPFNYFTYRELGPYGPFLWTIELSEGQDAASTTIAMRIKLIGAARQRLIMRVGQRRFRRTLETWVANLASMATSGGADNQD